MHETSHYATVVLTPVPKFLQESFESRILIGIRECSFNTFATLFCFSII